MSWHACCPTRAARSRADRSRREQDKARPWAARRYVHDRPAEHSPGSGKRISPEGAEARLGGRQRTRHGRRADGGTPSLDRAGELVAVREWATRVTSTRPSESAAWSTVPRASPHSSTWASLYEHVDRSAQIVQCTAQTHHLCVPVGHVRLDDEEVKVTPGACVAPGMGAEQDHPDRRARCLGQRVRGLLDGGIHDDHASGRGRRGSILVDALGGGCWRPHEEDGFDCVLLATALDFLL